MSDFKTIELLEEDIQQEFHGNGSKYFLDMT